MDNENKLAKRISAADVVAAFEASEADIREGCRLLDRAQERMRGALLSSLSLYERWSGCDPERPIEALNRKTWHAISERLELPRIMSNKAWSEFKRDIDSGGMPSVSTESIAQMLGSLGQNADRLMIDAVVEAYDLLRPHYVHHKTNAKNSGSVGEKVILESYVERGYRAGFAPDYDRADRIRTIARVFRLLDGKTTENETFWGELGEDIRRSQEATGQTEYFKWKCFGNGNLHLKFRRMDLVAELNRIAGEAYLAKPKGANHD